MTVTPLEDLLQQKLDELKTTGLRKGREKVITGIKPAEGKNGPRCFLAGYGKKSVFEVEFQFLSWIVFKY